MCSQPPSSRLCCHPKVCTEPLGAFLCAALASQHGLEHTSVTEERTGQSGPGACWHCCRKHPSQAGGTGLFPALPWQHRSRAMAEPPASACTPQQRAMLARCPDTGPRAEAAPGLLLSTPGHAWGHSSTPFSCTPCPTVCPQARRRPRAGAVPSPGAVQGGTGCVCLLQGTARLCWGGMAAAASLSLADPVPSWQQGRGVSRRSRPSCGCRRSPRQVQGRRRTWGCLCPVPML